MTKPPSATKSEGDGGIESIWPPEFLRDATPGIRYVNQRWPEQPTSDEQPIFIMGAGWRCGSTLVQRLVNSDPTALVFGEAYEHMLLWNQLAAQWGRFDPRDDQHSVYLSARETALSKDALHAKLTTEFIATLSPPVAQLKRAHQTFLLTLLKEPAAALGRTRWGMKGVRADASVLNYLKWLFPQARFVFITRDPIAAWQSYAAVTTADKRSWHVCMPDWTADTAAKFALLWRRVASAFFDAAAWPNARLIKYEELHQLDLADLERHLGLRLDARILDVAVGQSENKRRVDDAVAEEIRGVCGDLLTAFGY